MYSLKDFTDADRDACLPMIDYLVNECATTARKNGILALENIILKQDNEFLTFLMMLVIDGTAPDIVKDIGNNLLDSENYTGNTLLERIVILEGVLNVQMGENPHIINIKLLSILGESYLRSKGLYPYNGSLSAEVIHQRITDLCSKHSLSPENTPFNALIHKLPDVDIQTLIREIDRHEITIALKGCGVKSVKKVFDNLSVRLIISVLDDMQSMEVIDEVDIIDAQKSILDRYSKLVQFGEIEEN